MKRLAILVALLACLAGTTTASARTTYGCAVHVWISGQSYSGVVTRSYHTSCPFAQRVTETSLRYIVRSGGGGDGDFYVRVWSPVTRLTYRMHCFADGDLSASYGMHVDCRGGVGARVVYTAHD